MSGNGTSPAGKVCCSSVLVICGFGELESCLEVAGVGSSTRASSRLPAVTHRHCEAGTEVEEQCPTARGTTGTCLSSFCLCHTCGCQTLTPHLSDQRGRVPRRKLKRDEARRRERSGRHRSQEAMTPRVSWVSQRQLLTKSGAGRG